VLGTRATAVSTVVVNDTRRALQDLAKHVLARRREMRTPLRVVAITGSTGKTSAKDMLATVFADGGPTVATYGSFNNELGLPLTVLRVEELTRYLVLEMGARGIGHLAQLCAIAPPDVSLVLNVGKAHLGEFGSKEQIALAKGELVEALEPDGTAVLNADDPLVLAMGSRTLAHELTFGRAADAAVRLESLLLDDLGRPSFELRHSPPAGAVEVQQITLRLIGGHHALNAAATVAAALAAGMAFDRIAESLRGITHLSHWRMELTERPDGVRVINDAYNANPDSVRAALETLAAIGRRTGARTFAVLGEMRELGETATEEHRAIGRLVRELGIDELVVVGPEAAGIVEGATSSTDDLPWLSPLHARDVHEAAAWLSETVRGPDVVLVKASRGAELERVASSLLDDALHAAGDTDGKESGR
ncbi:MAG: UDP-N-acetylmuramoyl-tripeptide--D-alanyl-D-alanine ligase, partial [Actinomycetota bacterium]|nr:UDP-N-acetylmuramoyl-tripeptide--D-alanyl-D-alanine ligase [Actinomycetota bacterium]